MPSFAVVAAAASDGSLTVVGSSPSTSGWDGPAVTTNQIVPSGGYSNTSLSGLARQNQASMQASVSAPVLASANKFQFNSGQFLNAAIDEFGAGICRALAGIDILGLHPFGFMSAWADNLDAQAHQALSTGNTALATANSAVTSISTQQTQTQTGGNSVTVPTFPSNLSGSLGPAFTLSGTSGYASQVVWHTDGSGNAGPQSVSTTGNYTAFITAVHNQIMATDTHQATTVVGATNGSSAVSGLVVRATANMSSFVYTVAAAGQLVLGWGTLVSGTATFNKWQTINCALNSGDTLTLSASGTVYTVSVNGSPVTSANDSGVSSPVGASNRYCGLITEQYVTSNWSGTVVGQGWTMSSFNAGDTVAPPVVGIGWTLSQQSSSSVALPGSGGWSTLGGGAFDTAQVNSNKVTITSLGVGQVTIPVSGWYVLSVSVRLTSACGTGYVFQTGVYRTPSGGGARVLAMTGSEVCGDPVHRVAFTGVMFCSQGDVVQPAIYQAGSNSTVGDGTPDETYFSGTLCSFN